MRSLLRKSDAPGFDHHDRIEKLQSALSEVIRGKDSVLENVVTALLAGGDLLLEDVPGVGKTTLAKSISALIDLDYQRIQCTPDLMPADVFGFSVFDARDGTFQFRRGPVFCNLLLLDEINRASPRTQSALLEVMAERQVTVEGHRHELTAPFMVFATQNPSGHQGTFPLPESQLDRFLFRLSLDYPDFDSEVDLVFAEPSDGIRSRLEPVLTGVELLALQQDVKTVDVKRNLAEYLVQLVRATRSHSSVKLGCSPRGAQMLYRATQARAWMSGRAFALPDDVQHVAPLVLEHRLTVNAGDSAAGVMREILTQTKVPV